MTWCPTTSHTSLSWSFEPVKTSTRHITTRAFIEHENCEKSRGTALTELRCAFHGWAWNLNGSLKQIPCAYDYAGLKKEDEALPEVKLERWGRFIFINPDPDCDSLASHLGDLDSHFELLPYDKRYKAAHVGKVIKANWKVVQEAFMESYHVLMTHPQILTGGAHDGCTKYDAFENYSRAIRCGALESSGLPSWESATQPRRYDKAAAPA